MMSVFRIKRRLSQEPVKALVLAAKGKESSSDVDLEENPRTFILFKLCGTNEDNEETENMQNISDLIKESRLKSDHVKAWSNAKLINGSACSEQRYKVLSINKNVNSDLKVFDLLEILETEPDGVAGCSVSVEKLETPPDKFFYDFYYTDEKNFDVGDYIDNLVSVQHYSHDNVQESVETNDSPAVGGDHSNKEIHFGNQRTGEDDEPDNYEDLNEWRMAPLGRGVPYVWNFEGEALVRFQEMILELVMPVLSKIFPV